MPKKRAKSRLFKQKLDLNAAAVESTVPLAMTQTELLDMFVTTASQGITSETTLLTGTFFMPETWNPESDFPDDLREALIEFHIAGRMTTDAAAGTFTVRCRLGGTVVITDTHGEQNSRTGNRWSVWGHVTLGPRDGSLGVGTDANAVMNRIAQIGLFANETGIETQSAVGIAVDYEGMNTCTVTIQSSDAGTSIGECQGWMKITYRRPLDIRTRLT